MTEHSMTVDTTNFRLTLQVDSCTDIGTTRKLNEDSMFVGESVFLVADGMGGHSRGDVASRIVAETFKRSFNARQVANADEVVSAIARANAEIFGMSSNPDEPDSISGTTASGIALVRSGESEELNWMIFNIGDSRVYELGGILKQLTVDHSAVQELIDEGSITADEARLHPERNVVTRALGVDEIVEADVWLMPVAGQQTFLICTDGLVKDSEQSILEELVRDGTKRKDIRGVASRLIQAAIQSGGTDNLTAIVVQSEIHYFVEGDVDREGKGRTPEFLEQTIPRK